MLVDLETHSVFVLFCYCNPLQPFLFIFSVSSSFLSSVFLQIFFLNSFESSLGSFSSDGADEETGSTSCGCWEISAQEILKQGVLLKPPVSEKDRYLFHLHRCYRMSLFALKHSLTCNYLSVWDTKALHGPGVWKSVGVTDHVFII